MKDYDTCRARYAEIPMLITDTTFCASADGKDACQVSDAAAWSGVAWRGVAFELPGGSSRRCGSGGEAPPASLTQFPRTELSQREVTPSFPSPPPSP